MPSNPLPLEISPDALAPTLAAAGAPVLVDVREAWEVELVPFPNAQLIPLGELPERGPAELDPAHPVVLVCHHGLRSYRAALWLRAAGFSLAQSLHGGVDLWRQRVDPTMRAY